MFLKSVVNIVLLISLANVQCLPVLARTGVGTTVRGTLSRGGKAGNLWTLILDGPLEARDPTAVHPAKTVMLNELTFMGGRQGPQNSGFDGKHVELRGTLISPLFPERTGVIVKTITVLSDSDKANRPWLQRQLEELQTPYPVPPRYVVGFRNWEPLPLSLDDLETLDGIPIGGCTDARKERLSSDLSTLCDQKAESGISPSEAVRVLSEWVVVPKDFWLNNFSHTDQYRRVLKVRQTRGKDLVLELDPYGIAMVVFEDGGGAYLVSPCNAAGRKDRADRESKQIVPCKSDRYYLLFPCF